jgi:hypothetical protein
MDKPGKKARKPAPEPDEITGDPEQMKALGESISGTEPEIGHKDTGVGRKTRDRPRYPPAP